MQEACAPSIASHSSRIMDETTRGFLAQAIRDAFTSSGIDHNEEYIDSLISKVDNDVSQAHLANHEGNVEESPLRTTGSALKTPPASPDKGRGSYRLSNAQKRDYANLAGSRPRKRKRQISKPSRKSGDESTSDKIPDVTEVGYQSRNQQCVPVDDRVNSAHPLNILADTFSSYQPDSAFTMKAMASILFECFIVNTAIARYGHRTSMVLTRTDPDKIRKYADEVAEYDYEQAVSVIQRDSALAMGKGVQNRYNETIYWRIILKGAALIDHTKPLPRNSWKMLDMGWAQKTNGKAAFSGGTDSREAGIEKVLYYRTKEFDSYCKGYPKTSVISLVDAIKNWETQYRPHIEQLEIRALRLGKGDLVRLSDLDNNQVAERLKVHESSWDNAKNKWALASEEERFKEKGLKAFSPDVICAPCDKQDKSAFTFLLPQDGSSMSVCSIVPVREGDILGIFAGRIRFSEDLSATHGIRSPIDNIWLDYSQVTGTLNQMQVSEPGGPANVRLQWQAIHDDIESESCTSWRVSVRATKFIMPFDPLVRVAAQQEQYVLHSSSENARRGFLEFSKLIDKPLDHLC
ncbi:hypothetical protein N7448_011195 [Penicillium atrosanguineum]|nr:hypothetical protein N7448_011195 [Penicillium atrosanguineum]